MRKLLKYSNGDEYVVGGMVGIAPVTDEVPEEYDLSDLTDEEFKKFRKNKKDKKLRRIMKKL